MALHEVDKQGDKRLKPVVNAIDGVDRRMAHNTIGNSYRTSGLGVQQRMRFMNGLILTYDSDGLVSSVYGYIPEISDVPVLIIAKPGYDVFDDILGISAPTT